MWLQDILPNTVWNFRSSWSGDRELLTRIIRKLNNRKRAMKEFQWLQDLWCKVFIKETLRLVYCKGWAEAGSDGNKYRKLIYGNETRCGKTEWNDEKNELWSWQISASSRLDLYLMRTRKQRCKKNRNFNPQQKHTTTDPQLKVSPDIHQIITRQ